MQVYRYCSFINILQALIFMEFVVEQIYEIKYSSKKCNDLFCQRNCPQASLSSKFFFLTKSMKTACFTKYTNETTVDNLPSIKAQTMIILKPINWSKINKIWPSFFSASLRPRVVGVRNAFWLDWPATPAARKRTVNWWVQK